MNELTIPPSPNWYEPAILACSTDSTLIYGAWYDIVIMKNSTDSSFPANISIIPKAHSQKVVSVGANRQWGNPNKLIVSVGEDNIVKVWNADTLKKKNAHTGHVGQSKVVGASFAGEERVVSVSEEGIIIVWNINTNDINVHKNIFGFKVEITCMSTCPHASWLTAFGLKNGLVLIADLRRNGKLIHKLRGHDKSVTSLVWCPAPVNIFPKMPDNFVGTKKSDLVPTDIQNEIEHSSESDTNNKETAVDEILQVQLTNNSVLPDQSNTIEILGEENKNDTNNSDLTTESVIKEISEIEIDTISIQDLTNDSIANEITDSENQTNIAENSGIKTENPFTKLEQLNTDKVNISNEGIQDVKGDQNKDFSEEALSDSITVIKSVVMLESDSSKKDMSFVVEETNIEKENNFLKDKINSYKMEEQTTTKIVALEEEPRKEFLLASCSREGNIYIWRAGTDGRMQTFFSLGYTNRNNSRKNQLKVEKNWYTLFWPTPTKLLSSSRNSELLQWTLPKPKNKSKHVTVIHNDHSSTIFNIIGPIILLNEKNWIEESHINVWTFGNDRLLLNTGLGSHRTNLACYPTFGGSIECMQLSPLDPNRLAIGTGDGHIRLWDLSRSHVNNINMTDFYNKIKGKVETLAWHPVNEMLLAFGTMEGRVGCIDTSNKTKTTILYHQFFTKEIHKIEWGPMNGNKEKFGIYAVSEGKLVIFANKSDKEYMEVDKPENSYLFTFAWKQDYSILLVITKSGSIVTYSTDLKILSTYYCQPKMQHILWHPDSTGSCQSTSAHCFWFANVNNHKKITVYDLEMIKTKDDNSQESIIAKYEGLFLISSIAWCPYDPYQMVIGTEAGIAMVWNIKDDTFVSTYINPNFDPILSVCWSPVDPDFIIVGSRNNNLNIWKVSSHPSRNETEISNIRRKTINDISKEMTDLLPNQKEEKVNSENTIKPKKTKENDYLPSFYLARNKHEGLEDLKKLKEWKEESIPKEIINEIVPESHVPNLFDIFGPNLNMINLVKMNETKHKEKGKYSAQIGLSLFRGDITTAIKESIQEKRVTTKILTLAPMVSPKLWLEACETYAEQLSLEADTDPLEAVTYYLACHKVQEAIKVLCDATMYKEALALAKCRLMEGDATIPDIIEKWAKQFLFVGNYEMSAECYIFLEKYEDAVSVLFRRQNPEILEFAAELAEKSNNSELHKTILTRLNAFRNVKDNELQCSELPSKVQAVLEEHTSEMKCVDANQNNLLTEIDVIMLDKSEDQFDKNCMPLDSQVLNTQKSHAENHDILDYTNIANAANTVPENQEMLCHKPPDLDLLSVRFTDLQNLDTNS